MNKPDIEKIKNEFSKMKELSLDEQVNLINNIKIELHKVSPFNDEPTDCVLWIKSEDVYANDYNPNNVAPPEMELLSLSIGNDGYTQPIVTMKTKKGREVIDGFHRSRVGKEVEEIKNRVLGYLPIVNIKETQKNKGDRIASTIRHNRARGKHKIDAMSEIVVELKRRNWSDKKVAKQLGMDQDEVLRLTQITGLAEMFEDKEFSQAWEAELLKEEDVNIDYEALD